LRPPVILSRYVIPVLIIIKHPVQKAEYCINFYNWYYL